jgi:hypothetical protein
MSLRHEAKDFLLYFYYAALLLRHPRTLLANMLVMTFARELLVWTFTTTDSTIVSHYSLLGERLSSPGCGQRLTNSDSAPPATPVQRFVMQLFIG